MKQYLSCLMFCLLLFRLVSACAPVPPQTESIVEPVAEPGLEKSPVETVQDADAAVEPAPEAPAEVLPEPTPEPTPEPSVDAAVPEDAGPESVPEPEPPRQCQPNEACNALLNQDGICPGTCIPQPVKVSCRGTVKYGLCHSRPFNPTNTDANINGLMIKPGPVPEQVKEGDQADLEIRVTNSLTVAFQVALNYRMYPSWELVDASFKASKTLDFQAGETKTLTMKVKAIQANVFLHSLDARQIIAISFDGEPYSLSSTVGYAAGGNVACGANYFPATYCQQPGCPGDRTQYYTAKCCDDVFYPGASCCVAADCVNGGCYDGKCSAPRPTGLANTISRGHQRILIVLSDVLDIPSDPSKLCTNRYQDLKKRLRIEEFEVYFQKLSQQYTSQPGPKFEWVVYAGINTQDFNTGTGRDAGSMHQALEAHLIAKGCIKSGDDFDKRLLISSMADLGVFTGRAINGGRLTMKYIDMYLFAHELAHTYGASDLYLDQGGKLQYLIDLMGNNLGGLGFPTFGVAWGEVLWGDSNQNGVIDVFEFAVYPDELIATDLKAQFTGKGTIEVGADLVAMEAGVQKRIFVRTMRYELPDYNLNSDAPPGSTLAWSLSVQDREAIAKKGSVKVRLKASYLFTQPNFTRKEVVLDLLKDVPLTP